MSHPPRRQQYPVQPPPQQYAAVPQSPSRGPVYQHQQAPNYGPRAPTRSQSASSRRHNSGTSGRGAVAMGVATGQIGAGYGPYSYNPNQQQGVYANSRFSTTPSETSVVTRPSQERAAPPPMVGGIAPSNTIPQYLWDKDPDLDDHLHNPDPRYDGNSFTIFSARGWMNVGALVILVLGLIALFAGYPVIYHYTHLPPPIKGFNVGGINGTGQIPDLPGLPKLIDPDTPESALTRTGSDGKKYNLVFSDEFNVDGRTFYPGDDPFWEAADLHYWPTGDLEWYDPSAITTKDGKLTITMVEKQNHGLNFESGMLTSWNKLCFTTGYIEVSISLPGSVTAPGLWPGAWSLGNLGRAGYGATTEGMWPYSYDTCDLGTFPNQTAKDGTPEAAATGGKGGGPLSFLPGQRLSACTCPGSDHPGPKPNVGRGVPEIDIIEAEIDVSRFVGGASQSYQIAPYNLQYSIDDSTPATTIYDSNVTKLNTYTGGVFQQAVSAVTDLDSSWYGGNAYAPYAYEWWSDPNHRDQSYITWYRNNDKTWTITSATIGPDSASQVSQRLISEEPMYMIFNLGMAFNFQAQDFKHLTFPSTMYIDYVRVYQRQGVKNGVTCDPPNMPTADYIEKHLQAYTNPNLTTWAQAGNTFPRNSLYDGC